jgi:hypothetical protein
MIAKQAQADAASRLPGAPPPAPVLPPRYHGELIFDPDSRAQLKMALPMRLRESEPTLLYSTLMHGISQNTFYQKALKHPFTILVILDRSGHVFGGFATEPWKCFPSRSRKYYGTGECFLFSMKPKLQIYPWSRINDYFMYSDEKCIGFGGGGAGFGLWLDSDFLYGSSHPCGTYLNQVISSEVDFTCVHLELWAVAPYGTH